MTLSKLGWVLMNNDPESLWASVLRSKYLKSSEPIAEMKATRDSSALWKGILGVWPTYVKPRTYNLGDKFINL